MTTYVIEDSIPSFNLLQRYYHRTYTESNYYSNHSKPIQNKTNPIGNYYSKRKEALNKLVAKKRVITDINSNDYNKTKANDLEFFINIGYHPQSMITTYNEDSKSTKSNTHSQLTYNKANMPNKIATHFEKKNKEALGEISTLKRNQKKNFEIISKMYSDNTHLTKVNQLLFEELNKLNELQLKHEDVVSSIQLKYAKVNKENEKLLKEIESIKQCLNQSNPIKTDNKLKKKKNEGDQSLLLSSHYIQKLTTTNESYKNQNKKHKLIIANLEKTIEKLVKDNFQLSERSNNFNNNTNTFNSNKEIDSSMISRIDTSNKYSRVQVILALEKDNETLKSKVKELENKLALIDNIKEQESCSNIIIEDNTILESKDEDREIGIIFHSLFDNLCHLFKKKKMTYSKCITNKEEFCKLIEELQDEIRMMFIRSHYDDLDTIEKQYGNTIKDNDDNDDDNDDDNENNDKDIENELMEIQSYTSSKNEEEK